MDYIYIYLWDYICGWSMIQATDFRGSDLPSWLHFDDKKLQVRGTPPTQQETIPRTLEAIWGVGSRKFVTPPVFMECMLYNVVIHSVKYTYLFIHICVYIYIYMYMYSLYTRSILAMGITTNCGNFSNKHGEFTKTSGLPSSGSRVYISWSQRCVDS